jgi:hypothetical protein
VNQVMLEGRNQVTESSTNLLSQPIVLDTKLKDLMVTERDGCLHLVNVF